MGELTDLIFTVLGKVGRVFNTLGKRVCFLIWIFCLAYWVLRNYQLGLKVQTVGCLISIAMHIYGWFNWKDFKKVKKLSGNKL